MDGMQRIGWKEWVGLPELDIGPIKAKIDTGARTSALHAYDIHVDGDGPHVEFKVHTVQGRDDFHIAARAPLKEMREVRDSGGAATIRPVVETPVRIAGQTFTADVSLIDRQDMTFRMLLGRSAVRGRFVVDCAREYAGGVPAETRGWKPT